MIIQPDDYGLGFRYDYEFKDIGFKTRKNYLPVGIYYTIAKGYYNFERYDGKPLIMDTHVKSTIGLTLFIPDIEEYLYATNIFGIGLVYNYYNDYNENWPAYVLRPWSFDLTVGIRLNRFVNTISFDPIKRESIIAFGYLF